MMFNAISKLIADWVLYLKHLSVHESESDGSH